MKVVGVLLLVFCFTALHAEYEEAPEPVPAEPPMLRTKSPEKIDKEVGDTSSRKYFVPDTQRVDAGMFHVAFALGGNFYVEPQIASIGLAPTGEYFKDFGFQGGVYFDYDYSELADNIPLALRGMVGYKYILNSVHVFTFDGVIRRMFRMSEHSSFGLGIGGSAAVWYRQGSDRPTFANEEVIFLPSFVIGAGFDFNPFMVDFKWLINRFGENSTITGFELYFGFRL